MSNYSVNDDVYGVIMKTDRSLKHDPGYAEVFEAVAGLGWY